MWVLAPEVEAQARKKGGGLSDVTWSARLLSPIQKRTYLLTLASSNFTRSGSMRAYMSGISRHTSRFPFTKKCVDNRTWTSRTRLSGPAWTADIQKKCHVRHPTFPLVIEVKIDYARDRRLVMIGLRDLFSRIFLIIERVDSNNIATPTPNRTDQNEVLANSNFCKNLS